MGDKFASCKGDVIQPVQFVHGEQQCADICTGTMSPSKCLGYQVYAAPGEPKAVCIRFSAIVGATVYQPKDEVGVGRSLFFDRNHFS